MSTGDIRSAAVAGQFYPADGQELRALVEEYFAEAEGEAGPARAVIAPHAGLIYSGRCAARVFRRARIPAVVVILAPNHTGVVGAQGGASLWATGTFRTPLGDVRIAEAFARRLEDSSSLVEHDPSAHLREHAVEVELPFIRHLSPEAAIVPIVLCWEDWDHCKQLADDIARVVSDWPEAVLLVASSDMTHFESAQRAAEKDRVALAAIERLDGEELLRACKRRRITMCGRAPAAVAVEAARQLGARGAELIDYRHSGWVTGDDSSVVAYAGVIIS